MGTAGGVFRRIVPRRVVRSVGAATLALGFVVTVSPSAAHAEARTSSFSADAPVVDLAGGPVSNMWFVTWDGTEHQGSVGKVTPPGSVVQYPLAPDLEPRSLVAGPDGAMWFSVINDGESTVATGIGRVTSTGDLTFFSAPDGTVPDAVTVGADGALWFTSVNRALYDRNESIGRMTLTGDFSSYPLPLELLSGDARITTGADGRVYFTAFGNSNRVGRITTAGLITSYVVDDGSPLMFGDITGGASDGNVWFTEPSRDRVARISPGGKITNMPTTPLAPLGLSQRSAITAGPDGNLWIAITWGVVRMTPSFAMTTFRGVGGEAITSGSDQRVWFAQPWTATIHRMNGRLRFRETAMTINGTYEALSGDFNGDGLSDIFWYAAGSTQDSVSFANGDHTFSRRTFNVSRSYYPLTGDFNGDGITDVFWYAPGPTPDPVWFFRHDGTYKSVARSVSRSYRVIRGDFDGNHTTDIFWYAPGTGTDTLWLSRTDGTYRSVAKKVDATFDYTFWSDVNGDGKSDLIWWSAKTTSHPLWIATSSGSFRGTKILSPGAGSIPIVGWYDADNSTDIVWYGPGALRDGLAIAATGYNHIKALTINGQYDPLVGNWDGDANWLEDILWWNTGKDRDAFWASTMSGFDTSSYLNIQVPWEPHWPIFGYFDSDFAADVLFYDPGNGTDHMYSGNVGGSIWSPVSALAIAPRRDATYRNDSLAAVAKLVHPNGRS